MEFNRDRSCRPGYLQYVNARNRQIILVPTTYHSIPEPPYQSLLRGPYQPFEQFPQGMHPPLPCLGVGAQNVPHAMLQDQSYHSQERNSQNILEVSEPPLPHLQSQTLPFQPMLSNVEEVLPNDGYNGMTEQDTRQGENLGIDMPQLPEMCKGNSYDTGLTARPAAPPPDMVCRSCGGDQRWIRSVSTKSTFLG